MAIFQFLVLSCILGSLALARADDLDQYNELRAEVFGQRFTSTHNQYVGGKIAEMIELIERGGIPAEVQGHRDLKYLRSLIDDCNIGRQCKLDEDAAKLERLLDHRSRGMPNFGSYLEICRDKIYTLCTTTIYQRVKASFKLDHRARDTLAELNAEAAKALSSQQSRRRMLASNVDEQWRIDFHPIVLRALRRIDPEGHEKVASEWRSNQAALREHLDIIRASCAAALDQIDELVRLWPARESGFESNDSWDVLPNLHFTMKVCKKVTSEWDSIVAASMRDYDRY